jgi:hypothetical protein
VSYTYSQRLREIEEHRNQQYPGGSLRIKGEKLIYNFQTGKLYL